MKKIIGVLGRPASDNENYSLVGIYNEVRTSIIKKGCIPFMIMPLADIDYEKENKKNIPELTNSEKEDLKYMVDICDGIVIPGGYSWYYYDEYVVRYAIEKDIPVLGICMGMQLLSAYDNHENCLVKIESEINHNQRGVKYAHKLNIEDGTLLHNIIGTDQISVNSKHRYCVTRLNNFKVSAVSEDGIIEAIEHPDKRFILGIQWHPENMLEYDEVANKIYDAFIKEC